MQLLSYAFLFKYLTLVVFLIGFVTSPFDVNMVWLLIILDFLNSWTIDFLLIMAFYNPDHGLKPSRSRRSKRDGRHLNELKAKENDTRSSESIISKISTSGGGYSGGSPSGSKCSSYNHDQDCSEPELEKVSGYVLDRVSVQQIPGPKSSIEEGRCQGLPSNDAIITTTQSQSPSGVHHNADAANFYVAAASHTAAAVVIHSQSPRAGAEAADLNAVVMHSRSPR